MRIFIVSLSAIFILGGFSVWAKVEENPCQKITVACEKAGFVRNEVPDGKNLWQDCVAPIMQGHATVGPLTLPKVSSTLISQCREKYPLYGTGTTH